MAANRSVPSGSTPGVLSGNTYLTDVAEEIAALWDRAPNVLAITGGTANAITATITPALTGGFVNGMLFTLIPTADNIAGGVTVTVGASTIDIVDRDGNALGAGELKTARAGNLVFNAASGDLHLLGPTTPVFTKMFKSAQQTITSAGTLTIAHGLGIAPDLVVPTLECTTAENGYSIADVLSANFGLSSDGNNVAQGMSLVASSTNLVVRFGSTASAIAGLNKSTGGSANLTNASWKLVLRAFA